MKYNYTAAWTVVGGISLPTDVSHLEIARGNGFRFSLARDSNASLAEVDKGQAIARLMLKSLVGQRGTRDLNEALAIEMNEIRAERDKKVGSRPVLIYEAEGELEVTLKKPYREQDGFIVAFDIIDKAKMRQLQRLRVEAMKTAVAFESEIPSRFAELGDGTRLTTEDGKTAYSISLSMSGEVSVSTPLSSYGLESIANRYGILTRLNDLASVERLFSQMAEVDADKLKSFLSGWAALEILVAKSFRRYEEAFLSPFTNAGQATLRERFLTRIKGVMRDKYRLTDKFLAVSAVLFPDASSDQHHQDYERFCSLKKLRDSIFHGDPFSERDLPIDDLSKLLRKYCLALISTAGSPPNADD